MNKYIQKYNFFVLLSIGNHDDWGNVRNKTNDWKQDKITLWFSHPSFVSLANHCKVRGSSPTGAQIAQKCHFYCS